MTYALSWPLQEAVYGVLTGDTAVTALADVRVHDEPPHAQDASVGVYVTLGPETARDRGAADAALARHDFTISVHSDQRHGDEGFAELKKLGGAVSDALAGSTPSLSRGRVLSIRFLRATARRTAKPPRRRIDLVFQALLEDS